MRRAFSVSAYCRYQNQILLVLHKKQGAWVPVGGEVEYGEIPLDALKREVVEELGWFLGVDYDLPKVSPTPGTPPGLFTYEEHWAGPKGMHLNFAFLLDAKNPVSKTKCDEFTDMKWVSSLLELGENAAIPANVVSIVDQILKETPRSIETDVDFLLRSLATTLKEPVLPVSKYCAALKSWIDALREKHAGHPTEERRGHGHSYVDHLPHIYQDIRKSNLLGRLIYGAEKLRTVPCPEHQGEWSGCHPEPCPHGCGYTGWLPASP